MNEVVLDRKESELWANGHRQQFIDLLKPNGGKIYDYCDNLLAIIKPAELKVKAKPPPLPSRKINKPVALPTSSMYVLQYTCHEIKEFTDSLGQVHLLLGDAK